MKKHLLFLVLLAAIKGFSQNIVVSPAPTGNTGLTQWVNSQLVNNACLAQTGNASQTGFATYGGGASMGSFTNSNPNFPFASGVVLSTGLLSHVPGPNTTVSSDESLAWLGDADASSVLNMNSINATVLEFDFVAVTDRMSIDYIFASEEYGQFQCRSKDGVAILLSANGGSYVNVATTGGTPNSPVSVATIHSSVYNNTCTVPDANPGLFGQFNGGGNAASAPINFEGQTIVMNASATLVVGQSYHLKIVIADDGNANNATSGTEGKYDSAVFFPAGGFDLGQQVVGDNITLEDNNALCQGDTYAIRTGLIAANYQSIIWTRGGTQVASGPNIDITQSGTYTLTITTNDGCVATEDVEVYFAPQITPGAPQDLYACDNGGGNYTYNLALNTTRLKEGLNTLTQVTYHSSQEDATTSNSPLNANYVGPTNVTVYARVKSHNSSCFVVVPFQLLSVPAPLATAPPTYTLCESGAGVGTTTFNLSSQTPAILGSQPANQFTVQYYLSSADATNNLRAISPAGSYLSGNRTIYARVQSNLNTSCFTITSFAIAVTPLPTVPELTDVNACSSYTLQALPAGVRYYTATGGRGTQLAVGSAVTTTQTIYLYATSGACSYQTDFVVTIAAPVTVPTNVTSCTSYTLPFLPGGQEYRTAANGGGRVINGGTDITTTQTIYFYVPAASGCTATSSFTVTIVEGDDPADVNQCTPYVLPTLNAGNYYTQSGGRGDMLTAGQVIDRTQTLYVYNSLSGAPCVVNNEFTVTITNTNIAPVADVNACGSYTLPPLSVGRYYRNPGGSSSIGSGTEITTSRRLYVYAAIPGNPSCTQEASFFITILPVPALSTQPDVSACGSYVLPNLGNGIVYYTGPNATGTLYNPGATLTQTTVIYATTPANAEGCRRSRRFKVTVIGDTIDAPSSRTICDRFALPALVSGNYYNGPGGTGGQITEGTEITATKTIYVYAANGSSCNVENSFTITIKPLPVVSAQDVASCSTYTLPSEAGVTYYRSPNRGGGALPDGYTVSSTETLYAYAETGGSTNCIVDREFTVTIITGNLAPGNVTACGSYVLPELAFGEYRTAASGGGTVIAPGTAVESTQTIFVYSPTSGTNCTNNNSFTVTINPRNTIPNLNPVAACNEYFLRPRTDGGHYYAATGGAAAGNTELPVGYRVTNSMTVYVNNDNALCPSESRFPVRINQVRVDDIQNQQACENEGFVLPVPSVGRYYTMSGGPSVAGNTEIVPGTVINTPQTIYIYAAIAGTTPLCFDEKSFSVTLSPSPLVDTFTPAASCGEYILPALSTGNRYFTERGAGGTEYFAGQPINSAQTLYIFNQSTTPPFCSAESEFVILVDPEAPDNVTECDTYTLPDLPPGQFYYTGSGGPGAGNTQIPNGANITNTQDIYFYIPAAAACTTNTFFTVTINHTPILDPVPSSAIVECDEYTLPAISVGNYYTATGGPAGGGAVLDPSVPLTASQTVYVYAETGTSPNCASEAAFQVNITQTPVTDQRSNVSVCDSYTLDALTIGNYYLSPGGPSAPGQVALSAGDIITAPHSLIYIYAEAADNPSCFQENTFTVDIYSVNADTILAPGQTSIESCDNYVLPAISAGNAEYTQKYFQLSGGPETPGQTELRGGDVISASTTVYIYAELAGRTPTPCFEEVAIPVNIYPTPVLAAVDDVEECFTYTLPALPVTGGVTYGYYTATGGPSGRGTLIDPAVPITATGNTTTRQEVFLYAYTGAPNTDLCHDEESFVVNVYSIEVPEFDDVLACESYVLPVLTVGNYFTATNGGGTPYFAGDIITDSTPMFIYGVTQTTPACDDESTFSIEIVRRPRGIVPEALHACAVDDANNQGIFDLSPALTEALDGQTEVSVSVFETLADAQFNVRPITSLTAYPSLPAAMQTLYIRLASTRGIDCYTIVEVRLIVDPRPVAIEQTAPYSICDNGVSDTDGIGVFDLTTYESRVLGTLNPVQFDVAYYRDAAATNEITNPGTFESTGQTVYIRVFNIETGCDDIVELELIVNPMPAAVTPTPYTLCDDNASGDEIEVFDLTTKISEITNGANGVAVTFYTSFENADTDNNAISDADSRAYTNNGTVQTLFVRVEDVMSGCYRIVLMDLRVEPLPTLTIPTADDRTICDSDGNGYGEINLEDLIEDMINDGANIVVRFYMTQIGAENNNPNSIITNLADFRNQNPGMGQTIYVRAENTVTGCLSIVYPLDLIFNAAPQLPVVALEPLAGCDDELDQDNQDGIAEFDLTAYEAAIRAENPANGASLIITYHATEAEAEAGTPIIISPTEYLGTDAQVIWIRVQNPVTDCYAVTSFELEVDTPVDVAQPTTLVKCDYEQPTTPVNPANDQFYVFDLTEKDEEILGATGQGQDNIVTYYVTENDVTNGTPIADPTAYRNISNPQTLQVVVTTLNGCVSYTTLTIKVIPLPRPNPTPEPLEECDDEVIGDGKARFTLSDANADILQQSTLTTLTYWETEEAANDGTGTPLDLSYYSESKVIYVRAELAGSEPGDPVCAVVVPLELVVNPLPATEIAPYGICQTDFTGFAQFDLGNYRNTILPAGANQADYIVRYYAIDPRVTPPGAANQTLPFLYTNTSNPQEIWVYAQNLETECDVVLPLQLSVEPQTIANPVTPGLFDRCDDTDGDNDGEAIVNLRDADAQIIGTQTPGYYVAYYRNEADARAGQNPIPNPESFNTLSTTVWAMVRSDLPYGCPAYLEIPINIELLPEPVITNAEDSHTSCVDFVTGEVYHSVLLETGLTDPSYTYQWFVDGVAIPGATNSTYEAVESGVYTVTVTGAAPNFCTSVAVPGWDVTKSGPASLLGENGYVVSNAFAENQVITVLNDGFGEYQYSLFPDGPWQNSNVFTNVTTGYHNIYIRDITNGEEVCDAVVISDVSTIDYPRFFTPNNDGYNDYWNIVGLANFPSARIYIFDKYGKLLKQLSPKSDTRDGEGWDGTFNGNPLPSDDYWFTVTFPDGNTVREFKSHFAMKR
jgi:gliding motility-associated-like protein